jgi:hypothetical protein
MMVAVDRWSIFGGGLKLRFDIISRSPLTHHMVLHFVVGSKSFSTLKTFHFLLLKFVLKNI